MGENNYLVKNTYDSYSVISNKLCVFQISRPLPLMRVYFFQIEILLYTFMIVKMMEIIMRFYENRWKHLVLDVSNNLSKIHKNFKFSELFHDLSHL